MEKVENKSSTSFVCLTIYYYYINYIYININMYRLERLKGGGAFLEGWKKRKKGGDTSTFSTSLKNINYFLYNQLVERLKPVFNLVQPFQLVIKKGTKP